MAYSSLTVIKRCSESWWATQGRIELNSCEKCNGTQFSAGELRGTGGFATSFFNVQSKSFSYVTCDNCGYTEFYKKKLSDLQKVFDFLGG